VTFRLELTSTRATVGCACSEAPHDSSGTQKVRRLTAYEARDLSSRRPCAGIRLHRRNDKRKRIHTTTFQTIKTHFGLYCGSACSRA